ncbi:MAG: DUF1328 domain-containing protein [Alphaproteobacteria bacterium]|nr:DUF1328 domain-containing protein [Alphaproteobacteria bacterium]
MLSWALTFFILAVIAGVLGFGGLAGTFVSAAKLLFFAFIILFIISAFANVIRGKGTTPPV